MGETVDGDDYTYPQVAVTGAQAEIERSGRLILAQSAELADVYRRAERAEAALAAIQKPCTWQETDGGEGWATDCGEMHVIIAGTPVENGYRHCCYCGHSLAEQPWTEEVQP